MLFLTSRPNAGSCGIALVAVGALTIGQWQPIAAEQSPTALASRPCRVNGTVMGETPRCLARL